MDNWVSVAYHLPGITWPAYRRMSRTDRAMLATSLNRYLKRRNAMVTDRHVK